MADSNLAMPQEETYSDNCETHGNFIGKAVPMPFGSKVIRLGCPQCAAERKAKEDAENARTAARESEEARRAATERLRRAGVPLRYESKALDTYSVSNAGQEKALYAARRMVRSLREGSEAANLILAGTPGTGKTHLSCGIVLELWQTHKVCRIDLPDLIREIRATWRRSSERTEDEVLDWYGALDLLILEEVGTGAGTDDERARIFQVINRRYEAMLPTVVVTNLSIAELKAEMGERVIDRLREGKGAMVVFDWASARGASC